jgi:hypothetical protein
VLQLLRFWLLLLVISGRQGGQGWRRTRTRSWLEEETMRDQSLGSTCRNDVATLHG